MVLFFYKNEGLCIEEINYFFANEMKDTFSSTAIYKGILFFYSFRMQPDVLIWWYYILNSFFCVRLIYFCYTLYSFFPFFNMAQFSFLCYVLYLVLSLEIVFLLQKLCQFIVDLNIKYPFGAFNGIQ